MAILEFGEKKLMILINNIILFYIVFLVYALYALLKPELQSKINKILIMWLNLYK